MSIRFKCPKCQRTMVAFDKLSGRYVKCPDCSTQTVVPAPTEKNDASLPLPSEEPDLVDDEVEAESVEDDVTEVEVVDELARIEPEIIEESTLDIEPPKKKSSRIRLEKHAHEEDDLEWDITPMVDVVFLLLIFFMLTSSFTIQKVIRTPTQQSEEPSSNSTQQIIQEDNVDNITVRVDEFNAYTVLTSDGGMEDAFSRQDLASLLKRIRSEFGEEPPRIIVEAHEDSYHGAVVGALDAGREAGFIRFKMISVESFD